MRARTQETHCKDQVTLVLAVLLHLIAAPFSGAHSLLVMELVKLVK